MSAEKPLKVNEIENLFAGDVDMPSRDDIRKVLAELTEAYQDRGFELKQVASGYRIQVKQDYADWVGRLWEEKPARYTRALLETLALIAYRQPITRGEIEEVRGVSVSSNIIKTLMEREWIKVLGHKDVPGKPALYGTTRTFLDYFNLKTLDELPTLAEIRDLDQIHQELDLDIDNTEAADAEQDAAADEDAAASEGDEDSDAPATAAAEEAGEDTGAVDEEAAADADESADVAEHSGTEAMAETAEDEHETEPATADSEAGAGQDDEDDPLKAMAAADNTQSSVSEAADGGAGEDHDSEDVNDITDADSNKVKAIAAAVVDDVEAEEDFVEAEPQSAAS